MKYYRHLLKSSTKISVTQKKFYTLLLTHRYIHRKNHIGLTNQLHRQNATQLIVSVALCIKLLKVMIYSDVLVDIVQDNRGTVACHYESHSYPWHGMHPSLEKQLVLMVC